MDLPLSLLFWPPVRPEITSQTPTHCLTLRLAFGMTPMFHFDETDREDILAFLGIWAFSDAEALDNRHSTAMTNRIP
jgi:hypothetical protein